MGKNDCRRISCAETRQVAWPLSATIVAQEWRLLANRFLNCFKTGGCLSQRWTEEQWKKHWIKLSDLFPLPIRTAKGNGSACWNLRGLKALGCGPIVANIHNSLSLFASQKGMNIFLEVVQFTGRVIALRRSRRIVHIQRWPCKKTISVQWNWRTKKSIITINSRVILAESVWVPHVRWANTRYRGVKLEKVADMEACLWSTQPHVRSRNGVPYLRSAAVPLFHPWPQVRRPTWPRHDLYSNILLLEPVLSCPRRTTTSSSRWEPPLVWKLIWRLWCPAPTYWWLWWMKYSFIVYE